MKALSLTQPWADAILEQGKRIENREKWTACKYRGPVLLHAAKGLGTRSEVHERYVQIERIIGAAINTQREDLPPGGWLGGRFTHCKDSRGWYYDVSPRLHRGGIVGRAEIVDTLDPRDVGATCCVGDAFDAWIDRGGDPAQRRWWFGGFALILANVEPLPFRPCKGALGLFNLPDDFARAA